MNGGSIKTAVSRQAVSKMDRFELEDKYMELYDQNIILKKYGRKRDEEIKRLCAIQARLENDRKKLFSDSGARKLPETHYIDQIDQLKEKIMQLEKSNESLKMKLTVLRQKSAMSQAVGSAYPYIPSRIDSGVTKQVVDPQIIRNLRTIIQPKFSVSSKTKSKPSASTIATTTSMTDVMDEYVTSAPEVKSDRNLVNRSELIALMEQHARKIEEYERTISALKEQMKINERDHTGEINQVRLKLREDQRGSVKENVERIRMERELKEKSLKFQQLHDQFVNLEEKMLMLKRSNEQAVREIEGLQEQLNVERTKSADLLKRSEAAKSQMTSALESRARISDLERECEILRESNARLMSNAMDVEKENQWKKRETSLRLQIAQLEAAMQADMGQKGDMLEKIASEKDQLDRAQIEIRELKRKCAELKQKNEEHSDKMSIFGENGPLSNEEFLEALSIVKMRKNPIQSKMSDLSFLQKIENDNLDSNNPAELEKRLRQVQAEHVETINELEKTRNLLIVQYKINKDYQSELDIVSKKMEESKKECDVQLDRYAQLLDIRAERIRKLEAQLKDIAYGTKQVPVDTDDLVANYGEEEEEDYMLENGQNIFEVHIKSLTLTEECLRLLKDVGPNMFCTWEFYDFELQSTPILKGPRMDYDFTSQYVVQVDDFFIHYLQKDCCTLELHECLGSDYRTVAGGSLKLKGVLDKSAGRLHGTLNLIGLQNGQEGVSFGVLEYWVRLRVPMEQALRLYKERCKALGYIETNSKQGSLTSQAATPLDQSTAKRPPNNINQLTIHAKSCRNVKAFNAAKQPSPFFIYKFYDFPDHDSSIIHSSNDPFFDDKKTFPVAMTTQLDGYLRSQDLKIYLFDDTDPDLTSYLGIVTIPLVTLSHNQNISGEFEIIKCDGKPNGTIEVSLTWQFSYLTSQQDISNQLSSQSLISTKGKKTGIVSKDKNGEKPPTLSPSPPSASSAARKSSARSTPKGSKNSKNGEKPSPSPSPQLVTSRKNSTPQRNLETPPNVMSPQNSQRGSPQDGDKRSEKSFGKGGTEELDISHGNGTKEDESLRFDGNVAFLEGTTTMIEEEDHNQDNLPRGKSNTSSPRNVTGDFSEASMRTSMKDKTGNLSDDDSDIVVPKPRTSQKSPEDTVSITISHVRLTEDSPLLNDPNIEKLYVAYEFFGEPPEQTETPFSLPKPTQPDKPISFNFTRVFKVGKEENIEKRCFILNMLLKAGVDGSRLRFTLISEPIDDEGDCEDVGVAFVDLEKILEEDKNLDEDVPIQVSSNDTTIIGYMSLTVQCLDALKSIREEMKLEE